MTFRVEDLAHRSIGPFSIAEGHDLGTHEPLALRDGEGSGGRNLLPTYGRLITRPGFLLAFSPSPAVTGPILGLFQARFQDEATHLVLHAKAHVETWNGTTVTNRTGALVIAGSDIQPWNGDVVLNRYYASDGINEIIQWDGAAANFALISGLGGYTSPVTPLISRYLLGYANRLILFYTIEGGTTRGQRIRWCRNGNTADWTNLGAGAVDLFETGGEITKAVPSGDYVLVFKEDAIYAMRATGNYNAPFAFPGVLKFGCPAGGSVQTIAPGQIIFMGRDNVHLLSGTASDPIGDKISADLFSRLNHSRLRLVCSTVDYNLSRYYLFIPEANSGVDYCTYGYVYNWMDKTWAPIFYPAMEVHSVVRSSISAAVTIDSIATLIDNVSNTIDSYATNQGDPEIFTGSLSSAGVWKVFRLTEATSGDNNETIEISQQWESKDFKFNVLGYSQFFRINIYFNVVHLRIGEIAVEVSTDRGNTWVGINSVIYDSVGAGQFGSAYLGGVYGQLHRIRLSTVDRVEIVAVTLVVCDRGPDVVAP